MAERKSPAKQDLDDWEEVADNYSVVSLSSSDEDEDTAPATSSSKAPRDAPPDYTESREKKPPNTPTSLSQPAPSRCSSSEAAKNTSRAAAPFNRFVTSSPSTAAPDQALGQGSPIIGTITSTTEAVLALSPSNRNAMTVETSKEVGRHGERTPAESAGSSDRHSILEWFGTSMRRQASSLPMPYISNETAEDSFESTYRPSTDKEMEEAAGKFGRLRMNCGSPEDGESSSKPEGTLGETLDLDDSSMDPVCIGKTLESLYYYITDTLRRTGEQLAGLNDSLNVASSCHALMTQISELRPILTEYANQWEKPLGAKDIPLDPSLSLWLSSLQTTVSKLRRKSRLWTRHANTEEGKKVHSALLRLDAALDNHVKQMNDFLPIIHVDFNDYRTQHMSFPIEEIDEEAMSPKYTDTIPPRRTDRLSQVRNAIYSLKDQLQKTVEMMAICQNFLPEAASTTASDIVRRLGSTFNAASLALTNNGSEWLDSDLGRAQIGLLSHAEFSNLDPSTLHDFKVRLQQICNLVSSPADGHQWTDEMVRSHYVYMLVEQQQLDALCNIASILEDLMMPKHLKTRTEFDDFMKEM
ncbi:uncharacterized protein ColSpa_03198 [Colletotrichum spaethianum]|uniref:Uncharacterized protein n=1 Tax=Colletotrichum spaethianum TaxID=700344 RepID=A0AA37LF22_9PEZI|nr:uncharacterized protein ColSpa_03198 [Colletotrichum spaethianum]GKT43017.1 hypothetical protein ColSpa_03198 [Colletotrichum spaethianum]